MIEHLEQNGRYAADEHTPTKTDLSVAIIGAGFSGIGMAIQLKKAGIHSFTMFERASEVGGTWRDNTYPGAACDVPSHAYSLSFEQKATWSRKFSPSNEIQSYLLDLVDKWKLREHLRFEVEIEEARFDERSGTWTLRTEDGETVTAQVVVSGVGGLVDPKLPDIPGIESFEGKTFHTARWDHEYDLQGKTVAVIGTGASAVQVVPAIAPKVKKLQVFQRTPAWVVPKFDGEYSERTKSLFERFPLLLQLSRSFKYWMSELFGPIVYLNSPRLSKRGEQISIRHLHGQVKDPVLRKKLTPDFQFGCKRILISDEYWATFERENVELECESILAIEAGGIRTKDGTLHEVDAIVFATGFDLGLSNAPFPIFGLEGRPLSDAWKDGAVAYKGVSVSGFPNWFIIMGPNTGPGHTSVLVFTEAQMRHALGAIKKIRSEGLRYVDVRPDTQGHYNDKIQARMPHMAWGNCNSWYLNPDGSNYSLYPGPAFEYVAGAGHFEARDYECVTTEAPAEAREATAA
ncbi:MAG: NAD(P)/FAD-dependent oxidoreductase [Candidatus Binatia bacterium]|nr:NAD(P)/FAD-dependent oxidoreductase [Candidatus Binatia bacterium]